MIVAMLAKIEQACPNPAFGIDDWLCAGSLDFFFLIALIERVAS